MPTSQPNATTSPSPPTKKWPGLDSTITNPDPALPPIIPKHHPKPVLSNHAVLLKHIHQKNHPEKDMKALYGASSRTQMSLDKKRQNYLRDRREDYAQSHSRRKSVCHSNGFCYLWRQERGILWISEGIRKHALARPQSPCLRSKTEKSESPGRRVAVRIQLTATKPYVSSLATS